MAALGAQPNGFVSVDKQTPAGQVIVIISRGRLLLPLIAHADQSEPTADDDARPARQ